MGNNTLSTITGGIGRKEQVNQYKDALVGDILPRNTDGEVEALAGNLGSEAVPFFAVNSQEIIAKKISLLSGYYFEGLEEKTIWYEVGSHSVPLEKGIYFIKCFGGGATGIANTGGGGGGFCCGLISVLSSDVVSLSVGGTGGASLFSLNGEVQIVAYGGSGGSAGGFDIYVKKQAVLFGYGEITGNGGTTANGSSTSLGTSGGLVGTSPVTGGGGGGGGGGNGGNGSGTMGGAGGGGGGYYNGGDAPSQNVGGIGGAGRISITRVF